MAEPGCIFIPDSREPGDNAAVEKMGKSTKKRKRLRIAVGVAAGVLLLLLGAALIFAANLFGRGPEFPVEPLRTEDYALAGKLTMRLLNEIRTGRPEESELVLSPAEIASLLRIAGNGASIQSMLKGRGNSGANRTRPHDIRFKDGRFEILVPVETGFTWLWGGVIMIDMSVRPEKDDDRLALDISRMRAGSLAVPRFLVEKARRRSLDGIRQRREYREFDRCVKSIRVDDANNLRIVYRPAEIDNLLPEETRRILFLPARKK